MRSSVPVWGAHVPASAGHERACVAELTNLDLAHEVFQSLDRRGDGRVAVAEIKAAIVTVGLSPSALEDNAGLLTQRRHWEFADWQLFCARNPHIVALIADHRGVRPGVYRATASPSRGVPAGSLAEPGSVNHHRDLSPHRSRLPDSTRQQVVAERLHAGLASVVTAKDRERQDYSHAETMLPRSPALATRRASSPRRANSTPRRAQPQ